MCEITFTIEPKSHWAKSREAVKLKRKFNMTFLKPALLYGATILWTMKRKHANK